MKSILKASVPGVVALGMLASAAPVFAQYPDRPINLIIPFGAGGSTDIAGRALASALETILGQPVIVHNNAGGGGAVGMTQIFNAAPDGYTIGLGTGGLTIAPHAEQVEYDPLGFTYIAGYYELPHMAIVHPSVPVESLEELADWGKANPGALINSTIGGYSIGDVAAALFSETFEGVEYRTLPNTSAAEMTLRVLAGDANMMFASPATTLEHIRAGTLKPLAVITTTSLPELDAFGIDMTTDTYGFGLYHAAVVVGPPDLPEDIRVAIEDAVRKAAENPQMREQFESLSMALQFLPGDEAAEATKGTYEMYGEIIQRLMAAE